MSSSNSNPLSIPFPDEPGWQYASVPWLPLARGPKGQLALAVPEMIRQPINDLAIAVQAPGAALAGRLSDRQMEDAAGATGRALMYASGLNAAPAGEGTALAAFAGRRAATAPRAAAAKAMSMASQGVPREKIWNETGWYKDVDGEWKFEIPDFGARLKTEAFESEPYLESQRLRLPKGSEQRLMDVLHHPALYEAYPELQSYRVVPVPSHLEGRWAGFVDAATQTLHLSPDSAEKLQSTLHHEIQHVIQDREGFAHGGAKEAFLPEGFGKVASVPLARLGTARAVYLDNATKQFGEAPSLHGAAIAYDKLHAGTPLSEYEKATLLPHLNKALQVPGFQGYLAARAEARPFTEILSEANRRYWSLAGEVEARNVEERRAQGLGHETAPWATLGYPSGPQLVVRGREFGGHVLPMPESKYILQPVEYNPFQPTSNISSEARYTLQPVDHDPFSGASR